MKKFWYENGYSVVKLYLNQIAMAVFGIMVIMGFAGDMGDPIIVLCSFLAVGLYLFINYTMLWDAGAKAASKTLRKEDAGVEKIQTPLWIIFFGSLFNIICYIAYMFLRGHILANSLTEGDTYYDMGGLVSLIIRLANSIYMGFEALLYKDNVFMRTPPYFFFLTLLPLFIVGITAYYLGASEISILKKLGFKLGNKNKK